MRGGSILLFKKSSDPPLRWQSWICRAKGQLFNWIRKHSLSEMQRTDGEMSKQRLCPTHLDILLELQNRDILNFTFQLKNGISYASDVKIADRWAVVY